MKIRCQCGHQILDITDQVPQKAHFIPDQDWFTIYDALDALIDEVAGGGTSKELAYHRARQIVSRSARLAWQCRHCGRLYIDGLDKQLRRFSPEGEPIDLELLRSR